MEAYQERVIVERDELSLKIHKLCQFLLMRQSDSLPTEDQRLLTKQYGAMLEYHQILNQRINRFTQEQKS